MAEAIAVEKAVDTAPCEIWDALVDPTVRARWWPSSDFEPVLGASISDEQDTSGIIRNVVPHLRFEFTRSDATTVVLSLIPEDDKTVVRVREHGGARSQEPPWQDRLDTLESVLRAA